eukprot:g45624.t1
MVKMILMGPVASLYFGDNYRDNYPRTCQFIIFSGIIIYSVSGPLKFHGKARRDNYPRTCQFIIFSGIIIYSVSGTIRISRPRFLFYLATTPAEELEKSLCIGFTLDRVQVQMHGKGRECSFWAGSGEIMDLTEEHRVKAGNILHLLVVDGPMEPKKTISLHGALIEQMKLLNWKCGYVVANLPALCKIADHQSKGYYGCPWCWQNPKRNFDRMSWLTMENALLMWCSNCTKTSHLKLFKILLRALTLLILTLLVKQISNINI